MPDDEPASRFASTERYYAEYRPGYGREALAYLVDGFEVDADASVLDIGCGAGQLTVPLARHADRVVGMDPNPTMLDVAREEATAAGVSNIEWVCGSDADLDPSMGEFRLVTMGRSFHWMDQEHTLDVLHDLLEPGGGIAIVTGEEWLVRGERDWHATVHDVADSFLDDIPDRRPGHVEYDISWADLLAKKGFQDVETVHFEVPRQWRLHEILGYVFSLSYCSPTTFGDDKDAFEEAVRDRLADASDGGLFDHVEQVEIIAGATAP